MSLSISGIQALAFKRKYGLLISDSEVELISWKAGNFERISVFSNDEDGVGRFAALMDKNPKVYGNASFRIFANIIGEDYRTERVAHLIGKYKTDFHNRRMQQLFRGAALCMSVVQGREERGRREDIVLFYGMLTEAKVLPWMKEVAGRQTCNLEGVYAAAFINTELLKKIHPEWRKSSVLLMTLHEKSLLRQTFYERGNVRISRVSKVSADSAEEISSAIRKELERTVQYLNSLKVPLNNGLDIHFVCPGNVVGQVRELVKSSEKIRFTFYDASEVGNTLNLQTPMSDLGRDSSLSMQVMFSRIWFNQLAPLNTVRYYWLQGISKIAATAFILYGIVGFWNVTNAGLDAFSLRTSNTDLEARLSRVQRDYNEEIGLLEDPPSTPENITAVSQTFRVLSNLSIVPSQLIYYFASAYEKNKRLQIDNMRWYVSGSGSEQGGSGVPLIAGGDIYQILEVSGRFLELPGESYIDVANRADILMGSFDERGDIDIQAVDLPRRELGQESLGGTLTDDFNVEAARSRTFRLRIVWKQYDEEGILEISNQEV